MSTIPPILLAELTYVNNSRKSLNHKYMRDAAGFTAEETSVELTLGEKWGKHPSRMN
jgi:hypothetical protein